MSEIDNIIDLSINRETATVSQAGFGSANFLSNQARFDGRIKNYASVKEVNAAVGIGTDTKDFAAKYFGQPIKPKILYVTKKKNDVSAIYDLVFDADFVILNTIDLDINTVSITQTVFTTDQTTTLALVATNIAGSAAILTAVVTDPRTIRITGASAGLALVFANLVVALGASQAAGIFTLVEKEDNVGTDVASLIEASEEDDDWFALASYTRIEANILAIAAYMVAFKKINCAVTNDDDVKNGVADNILKQLKAFNYENTFLLFADTANTYPDGAVYGKNLPKDAGSITWNFKTLVGIAADKLTSAEIKAVRDDNGNVYIVVASRSMMSEGKMVNGEYIDIIRGAYWMHARIQEATFGRLVDTDKVPFENDGVALLTTDIDEVLKQSVGRTILKADPEPVVSAPDVRTVSTTDRANRYYPDITFTGEFAGAIHKLKAVGTISV